MRVIRSNDNGIQEHRGRGRRYFMRHPACPGQVYRCPEGPFESASDYLEEFVIRPIQAIQPLLGWISWAAGSVDGSPEGWTTNRGLEHQGGGLGSATAERIDLRRLGTLRLRDRFFGLWLRILRVPGQHMAATYVFVLCRPSFLFVIIFIFARRQFLVVISGFKLLRLYLQKNFIGYSESKFIQPSGGKHFLFDK